MIATRLPEALAVAAAAAILIFILFVPPPVGMADDGDFNAITRAFDFDANVPVDDDRWYKYIVLDYKIDQRLHWWSEFPSSEMLLVIPALVINRLVSRPGAFDLRVIGLVHAAFFLLALGLFVPLLRRFPPLWRALSYAIIILVFSDITYASYYNSFYMDTAALLFLLLAIVFFLRLTLRSVPSRIDRAGLVLSCILFITSKFQHSLCGLLLALLFVTRREYKTAALLAAVSIAFFLQAPAHYSALTRYNVIFYSILPNSKDPIGDLVRLGLDESYRSKIGKHGYSAGSGWDDQMLVGAFTVRATLPRLLAFYMTHPGTVWRQVAAGLDEAALQRSRIGNYAKSAGRPPAERSYAFAAWSSLKTRIFWDHPWRYRTYIGVLCVSLPWLCWRSRTKRRPDWIGGAVCLAAMAILTLLIGCLGDALDPIRHLFLFNAILDMLLVACLFAGLRPVTRDAPNNSPAVKVLPSILADG